MAELKEKEKADYKKILTDPVYKQSLGLTTESSICEYLGITPVTKGKWKEQLTRVDNPADKDNKFTKVLATLEKKAIEGKNPQNARVYKELLEYLRKQGDNGNREPNATDYNIIAIRTRDTLRKEYRESGGVCPICNQSKTLPNEPRLGAEHEREADRQVATLGISA
jgi:hypothetical protein